MEGYQFWAITGAIGLMVGALAYFLKRTLTDVEKKIDQTNVQISGKFEVVSKRVEKLEERFDQIIQDFPRTYAYRDDLIRMSQNLDSRLDKIQELLTSIKREG